MTSKATIVGWSHSPFGKLDVLDIEDLFSMVGNAALEHAGIKASDVNMAAVGVLNNGFSKQGFEGGHPFVERRDRFKQVIRFDLPE